MFHDCWPYCFRFFSGLHKKTKKKMGGFAQLRIVVFFSAWLSFSRGLVLVILFDLFLGFLSKSNPREGLGVFIDPQPSPLGS